MNDPDQMIGQTISHYRILEKIGEGGMGVVYLAEDIHLGRPVAIKFLAEKSNTHHYRARFLREARAISALTHPHIATIYDYGQTPDEHPFIVMELVEGETLSEILHGSGLTLQRAIEIIEHVAAALAEAHARGIIHRDIKPSNVLINERGQAKVLDFGLAKQLNEDQGQPVDSDANTMLSTRTHSDVVVGTPLYLSPEQAMSAPVDARSDLFALGALLYECITGRPAFSGASVLEIGAQVIHVTPPAPSTINARVPKKLDRVVMKALEKRPENRYQSAAEMQEDLRRVRLSMTDDAHHIKRLGGTGAHVKGTQTSALMALTETLREPRLSIFTVLLVALAVVLVGWAGWKFLRKGQHIPNDAAQQWYVTGTNALRNGAYFQASKALERAIAEDNNFPLAHARLAEAWVELDYADRAKDELLRVAQLVPDRSALPKSDALYLEAINAWVSNDFARAVSIYREIAQLTPEQPQVYVDLGRAFERKFEINKAIENYREATTRAPQYATAYLRVGILYAQQQDAASALVAFDKAGSLFQALGNAEGQAEVFYHRGMLFITQGRLNEAEAQMQQSLDMATANGNDLQKITALLGFSFLYNSQGVTDKGQQYANDAIAFAEQRGLSNVIGRGLNEVGLAYWASGDYEEAEKLFKQSLEYARRNKVRLREAFSLMHLGGLLIQRLRITEGLAYTKEALSFFEQSGNKTYVSICLTSLGRAYRRLGDYDAALQAFQQKLQLAREANDQTQIAFSYGDIATVLTERERFPEALARYDESYQINKSLGNNFSITFTLANRGNVLWRMGRYEQARDAFNQAGALASSGSYKAVLAYLSLQNAEIALSERRFQEASTIAGQLLEQTRTPDGKDFVYKDMAVQAKYIRALAQTFTGAGSEARKSCEEAVEMARDAGDAALLSKALLALAEVLLETGDAQGAFSRALEAQERLARAGQLESEWRAWLILSRASRLKGDDLTSQEQLARAAQVLSQLESEWGQEAFTSYLTRPDIRSMHKQLGAAVSAGP